jgi:hypothetical protein
MSDVFVQAPGTLVAFKSDSPQSLIFDLGAIQATGVVMNLTIDGSVAAQFQPSLDGTVYMTPFGDNVGNLTVSLLLNSRCHSGTDSASDFLDVYQSIRLSPDNPVPSNLIIGRKSFTGYATGFTLSASSESGQMVHGQLKFAAWMSL